jgi:hypothetical protein
VRLPESKDTRLLLAGVVTFVAFVAYLSVAFVNTHASSGASSPSTVNKVAPWTPYGSNLIAGSPTKGGGYVVHVLPAQTKSNYGAIVPTLVSEPTPGERFRVGLWLRGTRTRRSGADRIGVEVDEFRPGATSVKVVETTVPVTARWRHFTFSGRVKGRWLGLGLAVFRSASGSPRARFALRNLTVR